MPTEIRTTLLSMLHDEADHRDRQAREALFLTFNCDLGFLESQVLGAARGTGAAVTVVSDARVYEPDPRSVSAAGVRYVVGLASMRAVFHPKLVVLAGPQRATVAIGSGNLTISGWHLNEEVLTVVSGDMETGCPPLLRQTAEWLTRLASDFVRLGPSAARGVARTASELFALCDAAPLKSDGPQLLGNVAASLVSQLPSDPVDELRIFAPFHDLEGVAFGDLLDALRPNSVAVAIQPRLTVVDPYALLAVAARHEVALRFDLAEGATYRHGKAIEARYNGVPVWTLSGSPNLSHQALSRTVAEGGNCELAVLDHGRSELYPPTTAPIPHSELVAVRNGPPAAEEKPPEGRVQDGLLEAALDGATIRLTFSRPLSANRTVEVSEYLADPDQFERIVELDAGREEYTISADPEWSYPLRLRIRTEKGHGPVHFVTRLDLATSRASGRGGVRAPNYDPEQIFADERQANEWLAAVTQIALSSQLETRALGSRRDSISTHVSGGLTDAVWDDPAAWHAYLDEASHRMGESMVGFALGGLPRLTFISGTGRAAWEDDFTRKIDEVTADVLIPEPDDGLDEDEDEPSSGRAERDYGREERERYRRWLGTLLTKIEKLEAIDRVLRAGLVLRATRMKIWETASEAPWFEQLRIATCALPGDDIPPPLQPRISALAQVMMHELHAAARVTRAAGDIRAYLEAERSLRSLLAPVDESLIAAYAETLRVKGTIAPDPDLIARHAADALGQDPLERDLRRLHMAHPELIARRTGEFSLRLKSAERNPLLAGGYCLDTVSGDWAVFAMAQAGTRAFVARSGQLLLTGERKAEGNIRYRTYRLTSLTSPTRAASGDITAVETPPLNVVKGNGAKVLADLGIEPLDVRAFLAGA